MGKMRPNIYFGQQGLKQLQSFNSLDHIWKKDTVCALVKHNSVNQTHGVKEVDAICFARKCKVKCSFPRLTSCRTQKTQDSASWAFISLQTWLLPSYSLRYIPWDKPMKASKSLSHDCKRPPIAHIQPEHHHIIVTAQEKPGLLHQCKQCEKYAAEMK